MAEIDLKFTKGNAKTVKAMHTVYKDKKAAQKNQTPKKSK